MILDVLKWFLSKLYSAANVYTILIILAAILWQWWKKPHPKFPSGPRGIPFLGVLPFLGNDIHKTLKKWSLEKYGPVMSARMGLRDEIFLNTFETVNQAFVKQSSSFSGRPEIYIFNQVLGFNGVVFVDNSEKFRAQKNFGLNVLKNKFGMGRKGMEEIINEECSYFIEHLRKSIDKPVDLRLDFYNIIGNIIWKVALGKRYEYDDPSFRRVLHVVQSQFGDPVDAGLTLSVGLFPILRYIPPFRGANERFCEHERDLARTLQPVIDEHLKTFDKDNLRDFVDSFIYEQKYGVKPIERGFTARQLQVYARDLFIAGTETTSISLSWALLGLLVFPKYHKQIVKEVDEVIGRDINSSMAHRHKMPITCAFIEEIWRCCTPILQSIGHKTENDVDLMGFHIPKDTAVTANLWGVHYDPETWPDPMKFDPQRHLDNDGQFVLSNKVIPFSIGPRFCLGEHIARMEMFLILVTILQKFKLSPPPESIPDLSEGIFGLTHSPKRYRVILNEKD